MKKHYNIDSKSHKYTSCTACKCSEDCSECQRKRVLMTTAVNQFMSKAIKFESEYEVESAVIVMMAKDRTPHVQLVSGDIADFRLRCALDLIKQDLSGRIRLNLFSEFGE